MEDILEKVALDRIQLIDQYLNGNLSEKEMEIFDMRLQIDSSLKEDYIMVRDIMENDFSFARSLSDKRLARKQRVGKNLIDHGTGAMVVAFMLLGITAFLLAFVF